MCYRYVVPKEERHDLLFMSINNLSLLNEEEKDVFPGDEAPVILYNRKMEPSVFLMRWGYKLQNQLIFNTRCETAGERILFKEDFQSHRCLVPAKCYFESDSKRTHYRFSTKDEIMYLAGIYHKENDKLVFSILTRMPPEEIGRIHNRMPLILNGEDAKRWIDPSNDPSSLLLSGINDVKYKKEGE